MLAYLQDNRKYLYAGVGILTVAGIAMMWRRRASGSSEHGSNKNKKATMGGLVIYPVGSLWGTRPVPVWEPRQVTVVPVTFEGSGTLGALGLVWEAVHVHAAAKDATASTTATLAARALSVHSELSSSSSSSQHPAVETYKLDSICELKTETAPASASDKKKASGFGIFTHTVEATGTVSSVHADDDGARQQQQQQNLLSFFHVIPEESGRRGSEEAQQMTIVELVIDTATITSDNLRAQLCRAVECRPVVQERVAHLVATVPQSRARITVAPASRYSVAAAAAGAESNASSLVLQHLDDPDEKLVLDSSVQDQLKKNKKLEEAASNKKAATCTTKTTTTPFKVETLSEAEIVAIPRCGVTLVHPKIGVEMPFLPTYRVCEPRFGATDCIAVVSETAQWHLSFELWSDAAQLWFNGSQCDELFRLGVGGLLLPQGLSSEVEPVKLVQACGHDGCARLQTEAGGRYCAAVVFRRGPIVRRDDLQQVQSNAASGKRELVIIRFEHGTKDRSEVESEFAKLLDGVMVKI